MYLKGARTQMPNSTLLTVEKLSTRVMWNSVLQTNHTQLWRKVECKWSSLVQGGSTNEQPKSTPTGRLEKILGIQGSGVRWTVACAPLVLIKSQSQHKQRPQGRWWPWSDPAWALDHLCPCFNPFSVLREPECQDWHPHPTECGNLKMMPFAYSAQGLSAPCCLF